MTTGMTHRPLAKVHFFLCVPLRKPLRRNAIEITNLILLQEVSVQFPWTTEGKGEEEAIAFWLFWESAIALTHYYKTVNIG